MSASKTTKSKRILSSKILGYLYGIVIYTYGYIVATVLYTCSMEDGLLLKPTRPAMSLDSTFTQRAFGEGGPKGQLWTGYTAYKQSLVSAL